MYYLNSRYYDPEIGRFINADDIAVLDLTNITINGLNLYAYCLNNPVNEVDENGYIIWWIAAAIIAVAVTAGVAVGVSIGVQLATTGRINVFQTIFDGLMGALGGLLMITGLGPLGMALWNGALGFVGSVISQWIGTESFSKIQWGEAFLALGLNIFFNIRGSGAARNATFLNGKLLADPDYVKAQKAYNRVLKKISNNGYKYASNAAKYKDQKFTAMEEIRKRIVSPLIKNSLISSTLLTSIMYSIQFGYAVGTYHLRKLFNV